MGPGQLETSNAAPGQQCVWGGGETACSNENSKEEGGGDVCKKKVMLFIKNALREIVAQAVANDVELGLGHGGQRA